MSDIVRRHLIRYPHARPTTLVYLQKRAEMTERLKAEISASRRKKFFVRIMSWVWRRG